MTSKKDRYVAQRAETKRRLAQARKARQAYLRTICPKGTPPDVDCFLWFKRWYVDVSVDGVSLIGPLLRLGWQYSNFADALVLHAQSQEEAEAQALHKLGRLVWDDPEAFTHD